MGRFRRLDGGAAADRLCGGSPTSTSFSSVVRCARAEQGGDVAATDHAALNTEGVPVTSRRPRMLAAALAFEARITSATVASTVSAPTDDELFTRRPHDQHR